MKRWLKLWLKWVLIFWAINFVAGVILSAILWNIHP